MPDPDESEAKRLAIVHNERIKLRATYLNGLAIAILAVGGFAPLASHINASASPESYSLASGLGLICVLISWMIHKVAQRGLGDMQ